MKRPPAGTSIIFDTLGAEVQVQYETGNRLTTWTSVLEKAGYTINYTDYTRPIAQQLDTQQNVNKVLIVTTHQRADAPNLLPAIAPCTSFGFTSADLGHIEAWIYEKSGNLLLFVGRGQPFNQGGPYWAVNDIQLAAALGITTVFADFGQSNEQGQTIPMAMAPNPKAPPSIIKGVTTVEAWSSGGIVTTMNSNGSGEILVPLPPKSVDNSNLGYEPSDCAFAVLYRLGKGSVILIGHSGIAGNTGTTYPSWGQIGAGDNLTFLMNCVAYLAGGVS